MTEQELRELNERLSAVETAIQLLSGHILNLRTELLVIKALIQEKSEQEQEYQDTQKYMEHQYEGGEG